MTTQEAILYLKSKTETIELQPLYQICQWVLDSVSFQEGYGSNNKHHSYKGSLPIHTAEVMLNAMSMQASAAFDPPNLQVLIPAVIFHDFAKIRDYDKQGQPTDFKNKIYHVAGSYAVWFNYATGVGLDPELIDAVGHCILSHHGRREWKACVEPQTIEAHILHYADMLSANFGRDMKDPNETKSEELYNTYAQKNPDDYDAILAPNPFGQLGPVQGLYSEIGLGTTLSLADQTFPDGTIGGEDR